MDFTKWKQRCSSLGHIMTNLKKEGATPRQLELSERKEKALKGEAKELTPKMEEELAELIKKSKAPDVLSSGVYTHLDDVFRSAYWGRKRILDNKFLSKGNFCEEDSIDLVSKIEGKFLAKNKTRFSNNFIEGEPDINEEIIHDTKSSWDMDTFDKAELTSLYEWQIKGYCILTDKIAGRLDYCLVNAPEHLIVAEKNSMFYKMGTPDLMNDKYLENIRQIERNMIFDIKKFKEDNPYYDFDNEVLDFDVPKEFRIKSFDVSLDKTDVVNVERRVKMCRIYLVKKAQDIEMKRAMLNKVELETV